MVNLKEFLLEATVNEQKFLDALPSFSKYVKRDDQDFISKSVAAVREILRDKAASATQKYYCLQLINLGIQSGSKSFIENVSDKLLERLYLLAMHDYKNENIEMRGRKLLKQFDENADEEWSLKFYNLLLECFSRWGVDPGRSFSSFAAKTSTLGKSLTLPTSTKFIDCYAKYAAEFAQSAQPSDSKKSISGPPASGPAIAEQINVVLELLERLVKNKDENNERKIKDAAIEMNSLLQQYKESGAAQNQLTMNAARIIEGVVSASGPITGILRERFGLGYGSGPKSNPFFASMEEPVLTNTGTNHKQAATVSSKTEIVSPEDLKSLSNFVEIERSSFLRKISALEEENTRIREDKRRIDLKVIALEAELNERDRKINQLSQEISSKNDLFNQYVKDGLDFFRRSSNKNHPQMEKASYEKLPYDKLSYEKPSYDKMPYEKSSYEKPSYEKPSYDKASFEKPFSRQYHQFESKSYEPPRVQSAHHKLEDKYRRVHDDFESTGFNSGRYKDTSDLNTLKQNMAKAEDFVASFNADINSLLNRNSKPTAFGSRNDLDFSRKKEESAYSMAQTLDLGRTKQRIQSSRLDEYVKKYSDPGNDVFEPVGMSKGSEGMIKGRGDVPSKEGSAMGILKYKNF